MKMMFIGALAILFASASMALPSRYAGTCNQKLKGIEGNQKVFSDVTEQGESCATVYVAPAHLDLGATTVAFDPAMPEICSEAAAIQDEINRIASEMANLDLSTLEGAHKFRMLADLQNEKFDRYQQIMTQNRVAKASAQYHSRWRAELVKIQENNPDVRVMELPLKKVVLLTGGFTTSLTREEYLQSVPAVFGFEAFGDRSWAWDHKDHVDMKLSASEDSFVFTTLFGPAGACPLLNGANFQPVRPTMNLTWDAMDSDGTITKQASIL